MALRRSWCEICRGEQDGADLTKCPNCPRKFHAECCDGLKAKGWQCPMCENADPEAEKAAKAVNRKAKAASKLVRAVHVDLRTRSSTFFRQEKASLKPFVPKDRLLKLSTPLDKKRPKKVVALSIGPSESYIKAELRDYQVDGVNWILHQYATGVGGILADEMGLGKTIQTLSFMSALKASGVPGPHLVVTPLAVLQNWHNEAKRFTPGLSVVKVHGSQSERDRILTMPRVLSAEFDVYLTTYETVLSEEAFFTEAFLFSTITIDEGHRLKNDASKLNFALSRIETPFRLLLTGTPLQNNLNELWSLLQYILPEALSGCKQVFEDACKVNGSSSSSGGSSSGGGGGGGSVLDGAVVAAARTLLESLMVRRIKGEVESGLLPKQQFVLKVPLQPLQRKWYRSLLDWKRKDGDVLVEEEAEGGSSESEEGGKALLASGGNASGSGSATTLLSHKQLLSRMLQLQKVINHPKSVLLTLDRDREAARHLAKRAEGSEFVTIPACLQPPTAQALAAEEELRGLNTVEGLTQSCGKLALLDRLLGQHLAAGSRCLVFSQFTLTLDVLQEYCALRFGPEGTGFLRLDGATNRIKREMDVRSFNAAHSPVGVYLISTRAGGMGINLATADIVVLYDTCWNPQVDLQAQDRAHRIGQKKQVKVYRLIAEESFEERVLARARQKLILDAMVIKKKGEVDRAAQGLSSHAASSASSSSSSSPSSSSSSSSSSPRSASTTTTTTTSTEEDGGGCAAEETEEESMAKLSLEELWCFLNAGIDKVFDPTKSAAKQAQDPKRLQRPLPEAALDAIIANGQLYTKDDFGEEPPTEEELAEAAAEAERETAAAVAAAEEEAEKEEAEHWKAFSCPFAGGCAKRYTSKRYCGVHLDELCVRRHGAEEAVQEKGGVESSAPSAVSSAVNSSSAAAAAAAAASLSEPAAAVSAEFHADGETPIVPLHVLSTAAAAPPAPAVEGLASSGGGSSGGGKRVRVAAKRFIATSLGDKGQQPSSRPPLRHEEFCFACGDGGDLVECSVCPKVYHMTKACIAGLATEGEVPPGVWHCPWHECWECDRKSSEAGGVLFHCLTCPATYCFDCSPDRYTTQPTGTLQHQRLQSSLEGRGLKSNAKAFMFFNCDDCGQRPDLLLQLESALDKDEAAAQEATRAMVEGSKKVIFLESAESSDDDDGGEEDGYGDSDDDEGAGGFVEEEETDSESELEDEDEDLRYFVKAPVKPKRKLPYVSKKAAAAIAKAAKPFACPLQSCQKRYTTPRFCTTHEDQLCCVSAGDDDGDDGAEVLKRFVCPVKSCNKRYTTPRFCAIHEDQFCCVSAADDDEQALSVEPGAKKKRAKRDPNAPKKAKSAYNFFADTRRGPVNEEIPDVSFGELQKLLGTQWRALSEEEKAPFNEQAQDSKEKYKAAMEAYVPPPQSLGLDEDEGAGDTDKKKKRKKDPDAPKKPTNAYLFFLGQERSNVTAQNPDLVLTEIVKLLGAQWRALSEEEKAPFNEQAEDSREKYKAAMEVYVPPLQGLGVEEDEGAGGTNKKNKRKKDPDAPKKPTSAFFFFQGQERSNIKAQNPDLAMCELAKLMGAQWKALSEEEKAPFDELAEVSKEKYKAAMEVYVPPPEGLGLEEDEDEGVGATKKKKKRKKDPDAPKKPTTAFFFFLGQERSNVKAQNPDLAMSELGKLLGTQWKALSEEEKAPFNEQAEDSKEKYKAAMAVYVPPLQGLGVEEVEGVVDTGKKKRAKRDPNAPKQAKSAYNFFADTRRGPVKEEVPDMPFGEIVKLLGTQWKALSEEEKAPFNEQAEDSREKYKAAMVAYVADSSRGAAVHASVDAEEINNEVQEEVEYPGLEKGGHDESAVSSSSMSVSA